MDAAATPVTGDAARLLLEEASRILLQRRAALAAAHEAKRDKSGPLVATDTAPSHQHPVPPGTAPF